MPPSQIPTIFYGPLVNPTSISSYQALPNCLLAVGPSGDIEWIEEDVHRSALQAALARHESLDVPLVILQYGEFILPGFVDTHTVRTLLLNVPPWLAFDWLIDCCEIRSTHRKSRTSGGEPAWHSWIICR
jgi:guanine deaminase